MSGAPPSPEPHSQPGSAPERDPAPEPDSTADPEPAPGTARRAPPGPRPPSFDEAAIGYLDPLYGMALRLTRNPARAGDLVQDTFVKALRHWALFQEGTNLKAWLFKILTNTFFNDYKKRTREGPTVDFDEVQDYSLALAAPAEPAEVDRGGLPLAIYLREVMDETVLQALEELREPFRSAVLLVDIEEFSYQDAADILGTRIGTVRSRLFRGRMFLMDRLREYAREQGIGLSGQPPGEVGQQR